MAMEGYEEEFLGDAFNYLLQSDTYSWWKIKIFVFNQQQYNTQMGWKNI